MRKSTLLRDPFVFFDLGQTLIDERDFIAHFEKKFLEILNGFGARIDSRNYRAIRDSVIRDRKIGYGSVKELVSEVCRLATPSGYDRIIVKRLMPELDLGRKNLFKFYPYTRSTLELLSEKCHMGIIANQTEDILDLLNRSNMHDFFSVIAVSSAVGIKKPDLRIFEFAMRKAERDPCECIMVGDRLDNDIAPANRIGMTTVWITDSLFNIQKPKDKFEIPDYVIKNIEDLPNLMQEITKDR